MSSYIHRDLHYKHKTVIMSFTRHVSPNKMFFWWSNMLLFTFGACCMKWNDFCLCLLVEVSIPQAFAVYIPMKQYYQMEVAYSVFRRFFVYDWFSRFWPLKTLITPFTIASSLISCLITYMAVEHTNNTRIQWQHIYDCTKDSVPWW